MFAVIKVGGKQIRVSQGDKVAVEKIAGEPGSEIELKEVLLIGDQNRDIIVGTPLVANASVKATIIGQVKDTKVIVFKKERRQHYRRKNGHRQPLTHLLIKDICKA